MFTHSCSHSSLQGVLVATIALLVISIFRVQLVNADDNLESCSNPENCELQL